MPKNDTLSNFKLIREIKSIENTVSIKLLLIDIIHLNLSLKKKKRIKI